MDPTDGTRTTGRRGRLRRGAGGTVGPAGGHRGPLTAGVGLVLVVAGAAVFSGGSGAMLVGVVPLGSGVPAALAVLLGSTVTVAARTRLGTATGAR